MLTLSALRPLLASARTPEALAQLATWAETQSPVWRQAALLLQASWANNEQQAQRGLIAYDEAERTRNRITAGALGLLDEIESGASAPKSVLEGLQKQFLNEQVAAVLQGGNVTDLGGSNIQVQGSRDVVIGSGNTITKKKIAGLAWRQFLGLALGLLVLLAGGYFAFDLLSGNQAAAYISLQEIQKELKLRGDLDARVAERLEENKADIEKWLAEGMAAMKNKDYAPAVQNLEKVAEQAPLATVRQNLAFAYEQLGNAEKARENMEAAKKIDPTIQTGKSYAQIKGKRINLLAPENGGKMELATFEGLGQLIDGKNKTLTCSGLDWIVLSFKDGRTATFDQFGYYVPSRDRYHLKTFEIFYSNDKMGPFTSIGKFELFEGFIADTPYQEFKFPKVAAKYFKFQMSDNSGINSLYAYGIQLWGELK